ncbi:MAG: TatD family hydrolase [Patescibacteria group bacterium]|nr:TatD family hydrolase [Patescibacteria group bacterium]
MLKIIDSHCHLNLEPLYSGKGLREYNASTKKNWSHFWKQAQKSGVKGLIIPGTSLTSSQIAAKIARKNTNIFATIAIHPEEITLNSNPEISSLENSNPEESDYLPEKFLKELVKLKEIAKLNKQIVAVGETGLDYFHLKKNKQKNLGSTISLQKKLFVKHIQLANQLKLPLVLHVRDVNNCYHDKKCAYKDVITLIKKYYQFTKPLIFHCISGSRQYLKQILDLDAYISIAGNVTYPSAEEIREIVKMASLDKILVETDAPYLAPQSQRGKTNQPAFIKETVVFLQTNFAIKPEKLFVNTQQAFEIKIV